MWAEEEDKDGNLSGVYITRETQSLHDLVDDLELGLAAALLKYRSTAEELLCRHLELVEKRQASQDMEIANLKAENSVLRQKVGVDGNFAKNVMMQSNTAETKKGGNRGSMKKKGQKDEAENETQLDKGYGGRNKKGGGAGQAGGTWQHFVAWVPNGVGLQNPEPWKPMPALDMLDAAQNSKGSKKNKKGHGGQHDNANTMLSILPGQVDYDSSDHSSNSEKSDMVEKFELLEIWKRNKEGKKKPSQKKDTDGMSYFSGRTEDEDVAFGEAENRLCFIINPDSTRRIAWDFGSLALVVYDMIMVPMFSFQLPDNNFFDVMEWTARLFWTADMGWSCSTGIVLADGRVQYQFKAILRRYFKSWFWLDLFIVGSDWAGYIFFGTGSVQQYGQLARISRIVRVVRLLRLLRMQEVIANVTERIQSQNVGLVIQMFKLFIFLAAISHVFGCLWFTIGASGDGTSWIHEFKFDQVDIGGQYLVCLYWAVSQFLGSTSIVEPTNELERFFSICVTVFAFMAFLVMISTLTSSLTQQYIIGGSGARQMDTLRKYFKQNGLSKNLTKRLCRNAKHAVSGDLTPEAVDLLNVISEPLMVEMHFEMYSRPMCWHPFFHEFFVEAGPLMRRVCHSCVSMLLLASGDIVFRLWEEPSEPRMYIVISGTLEYTDAVSEVTPVTERQWVSEAVLWTNWRHHGTLTATSDVKLAMLDAVCFQDVCEHDMRKNKAGANPKAYAAEFVEELNKADFVTDLFTQQ